MKGAYRSIADPEDLLARERDQLTGLLTASRQDKGRRSNARRSSKAIAGAAVVAFLLLGGAVAFAVVQSSSDEASEQADRGSDAEAGNVSTSAAPTSTSEAPARAIMLQFAGGQYTERSCFVAIPGTPCNTDGFDLDAPFEMRCLPEGCTLLLSDDSTTPVGTETITYSETLTRDSEPACPPTTFTWDITPEGSSETRGIAHPARLTGTLTLFADAQNLAGNDCWGIRATYELDATPS